MCLLPQVYSNKLRLAASEVPGFHSLWCIGAQRKGMVITMKKVHCQTDVGIVQTFLRLTENNWRNSMYIECRVCKFPRSPVCANCADFLCYSWRTWRTVMLPVQEADIIFHRLIDKSECLLVISNVVFRDLYSNYFRRVANKSGECPFLQALKHEK